MQKYARFLGRARLTELCKVGAVARICRLAELGLGLRVTGLLAARCTAFNSLPFGHQAVADTVTIVLLLDRCIH